jgi:hypothetical protein
MVANIMSNIKRPEKKVSSQKRVYKKQYRKENGTNNSTHIFWITKCNGPKAASRSRTEIIEKK